MKERRTDQLCLQFHALEGWRTSVDQELEIAGNAPRQLESPALEARRKRCEVTEDELGTLPGVAFNPHGQTQTEVEGTIEGWGSLGVKLRVVVIVGIGVGLDVVDLQTPEVVKVTNEIGNLFVITVRTLQFQGLQGPQRRSEEFFHL